jgi:hypothetical protein
MCNSVVIKKANAIYRIGFFAKIQMDIESQVQILNDVEYRVIFLKRLGSYSKFSLAVFFIPNCFF